jgi:hypothetical protein
MTGGLVEGKFRGIMADHEVERFSIWDEMGDEMVVSGFLRFDIRDRDWGERMLTLCCRNRRSGVVKRLQSWHWGCLKVERVARRCIMMSTFRGKLRERESRPFWARRYTAFTYTCHAAKHR